MKPLHKLWNFLGGMALGAAVGAVTSYGVASSSDYFRNIRWVSAITSGVGIPIALVTYSRLNKACKVKPTQLDLDKAVLEQLKAKLENSNISPSDRLNLEPVIALYESTVEAQSIDQQTTLYQLLS